MTGRNLLFVTVGGAIGSLARYVVATFFSNLIPSAFPYGTFAVNFFGCIVIGIIYGMADRFGWFNADFRLFFATGICGGFTTFSSFAYENVKLLEEKDYVVFASYSAVSYVVGLASVFLGLTLIRNI